MSDRKRWVLPACLLALLAAGPGAKAQEKCGTLVNTLGNFSTSTEMPVAGVGGLSAARYQAIGPRIILSEPTVISEIGALALSPLPMLVQVRRASNGVPDPTEVIASYLLPHRRPPAFRYESLNPNLLLPAGTYFVLYLAQPNFYTEGGGYEGALAQTYGPTLRAESFPAGSLNTVTGESRFSEGEVGAVRVLGCKPSDSAKPSGAGTPQIMPPAPRAPAEPQPTPRFWGFEVVTGAPVTIARQASGVATAYCPGGRTVTGGGFLTGVPAGSSASPERMNVYTSSLSGATGWSVGGFNGSTGTPRQNKDLTLTAYAVCAPAQ